MSFIGDNLIDELDGFPVYEGVCNRLKIRFTKIKKADVWKNKKHQTIRGLKDNGARVSTEVPSKDDIDFYPRIKKLLIKADKYFSYYSDHLKRLQFIAFGLDFKNKKIWSFDIGEAFIHIDTFVFKKEDKYMITRFYDFVNIREKKAYWLSWDLEIDEDFDVVHESFRISG